MRINKLGDELLSIIYPKRCPICMDIIPINEEERICESCVEELPYIMEPRCKKCSKPLNSELAEYCFDCTKNEHDYTRGWAVWLYEGKLKKALQRYKNNNNNNYGRIFSKEVVTLYKREIVEAYVNLIIPVPLHIKKQRKRGYNQAEIIATYIGKYLDIPCNTNCVMRTINTKPQKNLSDKERVSNMKKAFKVIKPDEITGKTILICDDIYTTGNTIDSLAKELLINGAKEVFFITIAIGKGY
ncbi:ComF family protein [Vallitalea sp.]|jgi:ComF family protein|uniref:ComF family protein n=1 Tax=Vallitalea sp. TaxID=1882829 RepID=UPI0025D4D07F|nr:ComF family protein [Vallitalea sp.]MCT4687975.1 ComF family protein [Vallitalea sp.]